jgi:gamma-glutamylcyclotransferase (GGCT)/AIG2-like uncharacterized protein YtfP
VGKGIEPASRIRVFAYGSNLCQGRMVKRVPSARAAGVGWLPEHAFRFHKRSKEGSAKANAFATGNLADEVWGVIYEIDPAQIDKLDAAEGEGRGYHRREAMVSMRGGDTVCAFAYIADPDAIDDGLKPYTWYKRLVVEGARTHQLPSTYVELIEAAEATEDADRARDARERSQAC